MTEAYFQTITDLWRLFKGMLLESDAFSQDWWGRWVSKTNMIGVRHPGQLTVDLICALTTELERISRERDQKRL